MNWWVYKCNNNSGYYRPDWNWVFERNRRTQWGTTQTRGLQRLSPGDQIIAYQTDREEIVGIVEMIRFRPHNGHLQVILEPVERIGANVREMKRSHPSIAKMSAFRPSFPKTLYPISTKEVETVLRAAAKQAGRVSPFQILDDQAKLPSIERNGSGAGFGDAQENRKIERKAIKFVTTDYKSRGYSVTSVERDGCGFDLICKNGRFEEHVEVKGAKGAVPEFIVTGNEVRRARSDRLFVLCVVTNALSKTPRLQRLTGRRFLAQYRFTPLQFRAALR